MVRQALAAREGDGCNLEKSEARSERRGGLLLQDGLGALWWLRTCTQPRSWRTVKLRFAISGGADGSNDRGLKLDMPADQAGDHPKRTTDHWGSLAPAGRVEGAPRLVLGPTSHNRPVLIAISPPHIKQSTFFRLLTLPAKCRDSVGPRFTISLCTTASQTHDQADK